MALDDDDKPPVSIPSPFSGKTFAYGVMKAHHLVWVDQMLIARLTYSNSLHENTNREEEDLDFPLPGVTLDRASGVFYAPSTTGELIPVAHFKKVLFNQSVQLLPNAVVRTVHNSEGEINVILEAIRPADIEKYKNLPRPPTDTQIHIGNPFR